MGRQDKPISGENIGDLLRISRQQKRVSLSDIANYLHISKGYVSSVETGRDKATLQIVQGYEYVLEITDNSLTNAFLRQEKFKKNAHIIMQNLALNFTNAVVTRMNLSKTKERKDTLSEVLQLFLELVYQERELEEGKQNEE